MDKEKFSPGPWAYDGGFTVFSADGEPVCDLVSEAEINGEMRILPYEKNAALIEAAPVMYALLDMMQTFLEVSGDENTRIAFLTQIRKVLAKARGEE